MINKQSEPNTPSKQKANPIGQPLNDQLRQLQQKYLFTEDEILMIKNRFDKQADKGLLKKKQFRDSLGILGLEPHLADRIFQLIDEDKDDSITFDDFVRYLNMLLNGTTIDKAMWSFKMLSNNKNILEIEDMEKMTYEICYLWNSITGSKSIPKKELVEEIFGIFDTNRDGLVSFEEFSVIYAEGVDLIGWYQFLNNEDISINKIKEEWDNSVKSKKKRKRATLFNRPSIELQQRDILQLKLKMIQNELAECADMISQEKDREKQKDNIFLASFQIEDQYKTLKTHGPIFNEGQIQQVWGDDDPESEEQEYRQEQFQSVGDRFQHTLMNKLRQIIEISEQIKKLNNEQQMTLVQPEQSCVLRSGIKQKSATPIKVQNPSNQLSLNISLDEGLVDVSRKNLSIYFGHENWNLVLNMMLGIRKAIKALHPLTDAIVLTNAHYEIKHQFEIVTKRTADFDYRKSCQFYEFAPLIFERIRKLYNISNDDFLRSIGPEQLLGDLIFGNLTSLTEKVSSGKSGSFFYYSFDDKYMLKTISRDEFTYFKSIIKQYYHHLHENFNTLITKIFGLYKIKVLQSKTKAQKLYFVVMQNLFCVDQEVSSKYDLKGSLYQRTSRVKGKLIDQSIPLKDLDWLEDKQQLKLTAKVSELLKMQLKRDLQFFEQCKIIDYSLLVGIINNYKVSEEGDKRLLRFYEADYGGILSSDKKCIYLIGIIDIFTEFNNKKQLEHKLKHTFISKDVSCIPPGDYSDRFYKFINQSLN